MPLFDHEKTYRRKVWRYYRQVAQNVQAIITVNATADGRILDYEKLVTDLTIYSQAIENPTRELWLEIVQRQAVIIARDFQKSSGLKIDIQNANFISYIKNLVEQQVDLIKTLPLNSAVVAQRMSSEIALSTGERAETLVKKITGLEAGYPEYCAKRLARTEVARTQSELVKEQARSVGITQYVWNTVEDEAVRESHKLMDGKICDFENPPEVEPGKFYNPGGIYNCRCYATPLIPKNYED